MMSSHTIVEGGHGGETVTCESRSMKTTKPATARGSDQAPKKGPNPNKPKRYKKRGKKKKENQNCCQGAIRTRPSESEEKPKSPKDKEEDKESAQANAPTRMLSGFTILVKDVTAPRDQRKFVKGSQPTKKGKEDLPKGIRKVEHPGKERHKEENVDFPLIPPSGIGYRSCATFVRDKPQTKR